MNKTTKIMLALGSKNLEATIKGQISDGYIYTTSANRKGMIAPLVSQENPDILIARDALIGELNEDMYDIFYTLRAKYPMMRIIYLTVLTSEEQQNLAKFISIGIFDIWTTNKIHLQDIVNMVEHPKNFGDWANFVNQDEIQQSLTSISTLSANDKASANENKILNEIKNGENSGHLKIKQSINHVPDTMSKQKIVTTLVKSEGITLGRIKNQKFSDNKIKQNENINANIEFDIEIDNPINKNIPGPIPPKANKLANKHQQMENNSTTQQIAQQSKEVLKPQKNSQNIQPRNIATKTEKHIVTQQPVGLLAGVHRQNDTAKNLRERTLEVPVEIKRNLQTAAPIQTAPFTKRQIKSKENNNNDSQPQNNNYALQNEQRQKPETKQYNGPNVKASKNNVPVSSVKERSLNTKQEQVRQQTTNNVQTGIKEKDTLKNQKNASRKEKALGPKQETQILVFAKTNEASLSHTALNVAIELAKIGKRVAFINTQNYAAENFMIKGKRVCLYDKFIVEDGDFIELEKKDNLALIRIPVNDIPDLVFKIKQMNDADYIIIETNMNEEIDKLLCLSDKNYVMIDQNPLTLNWLNKKYSYRFKLMGVIVENFNPQRLSLESILSNTNAKKVVKIQDTPTMNYTAVLQRIPLLTLGEEYFSLYSELLKQIANEK